MQQNYLKLLSYPYTPFVVVIFFFCFQYVQAQQALEDRVRSGIGISIGSNLPSLGVNTILTDKSLMASLGYIYEYNLTNRWAIITGADIEYLNLKFKDNVKDDYFITYYTNTYFNHDYDEPNIVYTASEYKDIDPKNTGFTFLKTRNQKGVVLSVPIQIQLMSRFFHYTRFFGKVGLRNNFNLFNRSIDEINVAEMDNGYYTNSMTFSMKTKDMTLVYTNLALSGGLEWNFSGSRSLRFELDYGLNITSLYKRSKDDGHLYAQFDTNANGSTPYWIYGDLPSEKEKIINNNLQLQQIRFKLSLIF